MRVEAHACGGAICSTCREAWKRSGGCAPGRQRSRGRSAAHSVHHLTGAGALCLGHVLACVLSSPCVCCAASGARLFLLGYTGPSVLAGLHRLQGCISQLVATKVASHPCLHLSPQPLPHNPNSPAGHRPRAPAPLLLGGACLAAAPGPGSAHATPGGGRGAALRGGARVAAQLHVKHL